MPTSLLDVEWTQCSVSVNTEQFTFRGMHYQTNPVQLKYVKVVKGSIVDIALNLEDDSVKHMVLTEDDAVLISNNCAHGFLTLEPDTIVTYLIEGQYNPDSEHSIVWSSNEQVKDIVNSYVRNEELIISEKDAKGK
jgi:dTDP-4-dehydrorhamnose 3,5-epimerase